MLQYQGYYGEVSVDVEYGILFGRSVGMKDGFTFQAKSVDEIVPAFHEAVDDYLEFCAEDGVEPAKPFSGKIALRVAPDVHQKASTKAKAQGKSLNAWIAEVLANALIDTTGLEQRVGLGSIDFGSSFVVATHGAGGTILPFGQLPENADLAELRSAEPHAPTHGVFIRPVLFQAKTT
jgi:predicted HicB family RNase H-like nuclease